MRPDTFHDRVPEVDAADVTADKIVLDKVRANTSTASVTFTEMKVTDKHNQVDNSPFPAIKKRKIETMIADVVRERKVPRVVSSEEAVIVGIVTVDTAAGGVHVFPPPGQPATQNLASMADVQNAINAIPAAANLNANLANVPAVLNNIQAALAAMQNANNADNANVVNGLNAVQNGLNAVQNRLNAMQATLDANQAALHNICARAYNTEHATQPIHAIRPLVREANNPVGIIAAPGAVALNLGVASQIFPATLGAVHNLTNANFHRLRTEYQENFGVAPHARLTDKHRAFLAWIRS